VGSEMISAKFLQRFSIDMHMTGNLVNIHNTNNESWRMAYV